MGQGAQHLGGSLAPALPNPLLRRGIGASSLPAPPLVTTRVGPGRLAQGAGQRVCTARGCGTRSAAGRAYHDGHRGRARRRTPPGVPHPDLRPYRIKPGTIAPGSNEAAATNNRPQRIFRLNLRPGRARRLSEAGRHWAPMARQRATRKVRHSSLAWPTYCDKPKRAPPVMDGMERTVAQGDRRCIAENQHLYLRVFQGPGHGRRRRPGLNVAERHELPLKGPCLNVSNRLREAVRLARGSGGDRPSTDGRWSRQNCR